MSKQSLIKSGGPRSLSHTLDSDPFAPIFASLEPGKQTGSNECFPTPPIRNASVAVREKEGRRARKSGEIGVVLSVVLDVIIGAGPATPYGTP